MFYSSSLFSQDILTIKGKIIGNNSKSPLPFCPIQIKNTPVTVTANENGDFELHFSQQSINDTLFISYIGYETFKEPIQQVLSEKTEIFKLSEKPYLLNEVSVDVPISAKEIIKNVNANFKNNFDSKAFCTKAFFREYLKANEHYDKLMEVAVIAKSSGFNLRKSKWNNNELFLEEVRASLNIGPVKDVSNANNLAFIIGFPEKQMLERLNNSKLDFTIEETEYRGNDKIITIKYLINDEKYARRTYGLYKINTSNWAIEEYDYTNEISQERDNQVFQSSTDSTKMRYVSNNYIFKFIPLNGKYYFSYAKALSRQMLYNPKSTVDLYINMEYVTNDIQNKDCIVENSKKLNKKESLYKQICTQPYHPDFWKNYNLLVDNPELENVRKGLNSKGNIDEQFNNSNKYSTDSKKGKK